MSTGLRHGDFNPRSPRGGATRRYKLYYKHGAIYFNPRSPRGGSDRRSISNINRGIYFNPRSPRGGATTVQPAFPTPVRYFNPRSPRGGATGRYAFAPFAIPHISIHAPHEGERHAVQVGDYYGSEISIHAPHEGERRSCSSTVGGIVGFQSTLPTRGSDHFLRSARRQPCDFNPRSPRGGATDWAKALERHGVISIHAPHEGERLYWVSCVTGATRHFNPRSPRGGATSTLTRTLQGTTDFNPRSPRGGATV